MTGTILAFLVAGNTVALLLFWFAYAFHVLRQMSADVLRAEEQMRLHQDGWDKVRGIPEEQAAARMFKTSAQIYDQVRYSYNLAYSKPIYRFPGFVMGFRSIP